MSSEQPIRSRFSRYALARARYVVAATGFATLFLLSISLSSLARDATEAKRRGAGDVALYRAEIERIRAGDGYYQAAAAELTARGYPTRSVFNWRTPLPIAVLGKLPNLDFGKAVLGGLAAALLLVSYELAYRESGVKAALQTMLWMTGALLPCVLGELLLMPVLWAGVLIALSLCLYGIGRSYLAIAAGLAALFLRELAAPYCLLAMLFALHDRKWREVAVWGTGFALYACFFAAHVVQVLAVRAPDAMAHESSWLCWGGAPFILSIVQMNAYLLLLPQWVTVLFFVTALVGLAGWNSTAGERIGLTVALYLALFAAVGQPFNQYWGCLIAPTLCLGAGRGPEAMADLLRATRRSSAAVVTPVQASCSTLH